MPALLVASDLRIDVGGCPAIDGLTLDTTGDRVLVLGAAKALFEAVAGLRPIARGELRVEGVCVLAAIRRGLAACAPLDPPLPPSWTVFQYVVWSARLAGHGRATAHALAHDAVVRMQLAPFATMKLGRAPLTPRRGAVVAAALATGAKTLIVEDPLAGLTEELGRPFARAVARAVADLRTVLFAARMPLDCPFALTADEAVVVAGSHVAVQGAPAEIAASERLLALRVHGDVAGFVRAVEALGARAILAPGRGAASEVRVDLGPLAARDLLRIAAEAEAVVMELRPLARVFA